MQNLNERRSPLGRAWIFILTAPTDPVVQDLKVVVDQYLDPTEDLRKFEFTAIHLVILGLSRINLEDQLQLDTSELDIGSSSGRTPLMWAVERGDKDTVKTLLDFGARLDIRDKRGFNVFYMAADSPDVEILEILISAAYSQSPSCDQSLNSNPGTMTSVDWAPKKSTQSCRHINPYVKALLDCSDYAYGHTALVRTTGRDRLGHAKILIAHGATIEAAIGNFPCHVETPLAYCVGYNSHQVLKLLLNAGARTNIRDMDDMTILHAVSRRGDIKTIRILREANLCCLDIFEKDIYERTPLEEFDIGRPEIRSQEDERTQQRCRREFIGLLESVKPVGSDHICTVRGPPDLNYGATGVEEGDEIASVHSSEDDDEDGDPDSIHIRGPAILDDETTEVEESDDNGDEVEDGDGNSPSNSSHICNVRGSLDTNCQTTEIKEGKEIAPIPSQPSGDENGDDDEFFNAYPTFEEVI